MAFFKKMMASIGIGGAKVETILDIDGGGVPAGEVIQGTFRIEGGKVEQRIDDVELQLCCNYFVEVERGEETVIEERTYILTEHELDIDSNIQPGEKREIDFSMKLPAYTPETFGKHKVWIRTNLDIDNAVDASDKDYIKVLPHPVTAAGFAALEHLGFRLKEVMQLVGSIKDWPLPFVMEYEYLPGRDFSNLDEIEVMFFAGEYETRVHLEVDKKTRGLGGWLADALDLDETKLSFTITEEDAEDVDALAATFAGIIEEAM